MTSEIPTLKFPEGIIEIRPGPHPGVHELRTIAMDPDTFVARTVCHTTFPRELLDWLATRFTFGWYCESLSRHEDPDYVVGILRKQMQAYFAPNSLAGKRILDFGCGSGASTMCLATEFPSSEVIGIELSPESLAIAQAILQFRKLKNARFLQSPSGNSLPGELGQFDVVMLSAVYEHLLPEERLTVLPLVWAATKVGGTVLINQTPHRWFPYEHHSTGLPFINYLPDSVTHVLARRFSRLNPSANRMRNWEEHLRGGIRGGTEKGIIRDLTGGNPSAARIRPLSAPGLKDRAQYWLSRTGRSRYGKIKRVIAGMFRLSDRLFDTIPSTNVDVAIEKLC